MVFILEGDPEELIAARTLNPVLANGLPRLSLKPLRERRSDIPGLIDAWMKRHDYHKIPYQYRNNEGNIMTAHRSLKLEQSALETFCYFDYPGNISQLNRLLQETVEKHKLDTRRNWDQTPIAVKSLPQEIFRAADNLYEEMAYEVAKVELRYIEQAFLKFAGQRGSKGKVAHELNIPSGADNLKKTYIAKYWKRYPELVRQHPAIMKAYKLNES